MLYVDSVSVESKIVIPKFLDPPSLNDAPPPYSLSINRCRKGEIILFPSQYSVLRHAIQTQD